MPSVPSISPATGKPTTTSYVHTTDLNFVDNAGRTLLLRGVNLSGASKAPVGHPSYVLDDFWESAEAGGESFIGRPLNIDDGSADVHLARLRGWGFNMLRFPFTWEALEHEGPGKYDYEYMDYTIRVLQRCKNYGFRVYMDPHQDTWSRFSGGSGAPYWTLAACGINPRNITATQAAILHCEFPLAHAPDPASLPAMIWSTNYGRLLSQTVFTLFFAGRDFAPDCIIDSMNIQDYLQSHYIEACGKLADRIREYDEGSLYEDCIIGWDSLNEPFEGLCGWEDLNLNPTRQGSTLKKGTHPTPAQSLRLGMGQAQTVENWSFGTFGPARDGSVTIDPKGHKLWADPVAGDEETTGSETREGPDGVSLRWGWKRDVSKWPLGKCIWAHHGVWDIETGFILQPDYFKFNPITGEEVEFISDYWRPHFLAYIERIRIAHPEAIWFVQPPVFARPPEIEKDVLGGRCAYSGHYYDGLTLVTRHWNWFNADALGLLRGKYNSPYQAVKIGEGAIRKSLREQLALLKSDVLILGQYPTVIGEIGTPFDMDSKRSYGWTDNGKYLGDYSRQEKALDASLNACDGGNGLSYTIWTFCPDDHSHEWGDEWNMEDLSIWSPADLRENRKDSRPKGEANADDVDGSVYIAEDERLGDSRAVLLRRKMSTLSRLGGEEQPKPTLAMLAARSSLSLATLGTATIADASSVKSRIAALDRPSSIGWHPNPFDFLTDGARAVKAFARPYPVKVVGRPTNIQFDVGKAHFKLVVVVRSEDRLKPGGLGVDQRRSESISKQPAEVTVQEVIDEGESPIEEKSLPTEVFIPLVQFAHPRILEPRSRSERRQYRRKQERDPDTHSISTISSVASDAGSTHADSHRTAVGTGVTSTPVLTGRETPDLVKSDMERLSSYESGGTDSTAIGGISDHAKIFDIPVVGAAPIYPPSRHIGRAGVLPHLEEDLVDVEVRASAGQWRVEGQTLLWWYEVPGEGEPDREYTLEVKRRGGAIKIKEEQERLGGGSLCEQLCPQDGCIVM